jgi:AmiR/NasT family two-component response regulator
MGEASELQTRRLGCHDVCLEVVIFAMVASRPDVVHLAIISRAEHVLTAHSVATVHVAVVIMQAGGYNKM